MKNVQKSAGAELRPAKALAPEDGPIVMMTRADLAELVADAVIAALAEFEAGKQPAPELLSGAQMAMKLGISRSKLHGLRVGGCPAIKLGDSYKFDPIAVLAHVRGGK